MSKQMPQLCHGDVLKDVCGNYYWLFSVKHAYYIQPSLGDSFSVESRQTVEDIAIVEVYRNEMESCMSVEAIASILAGRSAGCGVSRIWKMPDPVREMTVDQISEALGYKVKVVGDGLQ